MKTKLTSLSLIVLTCAMAGCRTAPKTSAIPYGEPSKHFTLRVTGAPGLAFGATITGDGLARGVSGVTPATFDVSGHRISCTLAKRTAQGRLSLEVWEGDAYIGKSTTVNSFGSVHAEILSLADVQRKTFSPSDPDDIAREIAPFHPALTNTP